MTELLKPAALLVFGALISPRLVEEIRHMGLRFATVALVLVRPAPITAFSGHFVILRGKNVYYRLADTWVELTLRFVSPAHGTRHVKDAMCREIIEQLDAAGIGIASATLEIVGLPPVQLTSKNG